MRTRRGELRISSGTAGHREAEGGSLNHSRPRGGGRKKMSTTIRSRFWLMAGLVFGAALLRLLPHPPNFTPVAAIALFGGAHFARKFWAFAVPLAAMFVSDAVLEVATGRGFTSGMPV